MKRRKLCSLILAIFLGLLGVFSTKSITVFAEEVISEQNSSVSEKPSVEEVQKEQYMQILKLYYQSILSYCDSMGVNVDEEVTLEAFYDAYYAQDTYLISEYEQYVKYVAATRGALALSDLQVDPNVKVPSELPTAPISSVEMEYIVGIGLFALTVVLLIGVPIVLFAKKKK